MKKLSAQQWLTALERVVLTLWVGGLWAIGYIAAPTLFSELTDNRQLAGSLAGPMFTAVGYIGLVAGFVLFFSSLQTLGKQWRAWILLMMWIIVLVSLFVLQPMMQELKLQGLVPGSEQQARFGMLHGISAMLHLLLSLSGALLVAVGLRPDTKTR